MSTQEQQANGGTALATKPQAQIETRREIALGPQGIALSSLDDAWRFANMLSKSGLAPKGIESPEQIVIAMQMGMEVGLTPMAALQNIAVINGRPTLWGDAMLAVCRASGHFDESVFEEFFEGREQALEAVCRVARKGAKIVERRFSMGDARCAGLSGKNGPWTQYPRRMLQMRARSWALRDAFSDVLRGMRSAEETRDLDMNEVPEERRLAAAAATRDLNRANGEARSIAPKTVDLNAAAPPLPEALAFDADPFDARPEDTTKAEAKPAEAEGGQQAPVAYRVADATDDEVLAALTAYANALAAEYGEPVAAVCERVFRFTYVNKAKNETVEEKVPSLGWFTAERTEAKAKARMAIARNIATRLQGENDPRFCLRRLEAQGGAR